MTALCLDVKPPNAGGTPTPGKLMVVWRQLDGDGPDPMPEVAYQAAFAGTETTIQIPLSQINPPSAVNMLCNRSCGDEATCPCTGAAKVGTGFVLVYSDANGDGQITVDFQRDQSEPIVGVGQVLIAQSDASHIPAPSQPDFWQNVFRSGIEQGLRAYSIQNDGDGDHQRYGAASVSGTTYPLKTCPVSQPAEECELKRPNPM